MTAPDPARRPPASARELDALLAGGTLAGAEKERILEQLLRDTGRRSRRLSRSLAWALPVCAAAALLLLWQARPPVDPDDGPALLRAKGAAATGPLVTAGCRDACRRGSTLLLRIEGLHRSAHVAAYAHQPGGERIWYFPDAGGAQPLVPASSEPVVLRRGVRIGSEHPPGRYEVRVVFSPAPVSRAELRRAAGRFPEAVAHFEVLP